MFKHEDIVPVETNFNGIYIGVVEDNVDPDKMGRVRVRVMGLHSDSKMTTGNDGVTTAQLPWAIPASPIQGGSISGRGWSGVPEQGSHVLITFIGGDHSFPIYFASIASKYTEKPDFNKGFSDPARIFPESAGVQDWHEGTRSPISKGTRTTGSVVNEPANTANPTYPKNVVLDLGGAILEFDNTPGNTRYAMFHKETKSYIEFQHSGDTVFKSAKDAYEIVAGTKKVLIKGAQTEEVQGTLDVTVVGNVNLKSTTGTITFKGKNGGDQTGVITYNSICHFTGKEHLDCSKNVLATKENG